MSDRIAVMGNGHIEQVGTKEEIFDKPTSEYAANFLGLNTFKGKAIRDNGGFLEIEINDVSLIANSNIHLVGRNIIATLKPEDISLSKAINPTLKCPGNMVLGTVTGILQMRSTGQVTVDCGFMLKTRLSLGAIKDMGLTVGDKVHVCFSADSLNTIVDNDN
jgi:ABC-type Fe3+/spermidine/putrescine transport system ATPase subunit